MKKFILKNKFALISIAILFGWLILELIRTYPIYLTCNLEDSNIKDPLLFYYIIFANSSLYNLPLVAPLFVIIPSIFSFHQQLSTGFVKNCLTRINYKEYLKKEYLKSFKWSLLLPLFVFIFLIISCFVTGSLDFGSGKEYYGYLSSPPIKFAKCAGLFIFTYIINLFFHSILYINIGLIFCKKNSNFIATIILSYISYIVLDIILEVFVGGLFFAKLLNIHNVSILLNLFNFWVYDGVSNLILSIVFSIMLSILSTFIVFGIYKNKEGVIIESEK